MTVRNYVDNASTKKLSGSITSGATSITLDSVTGLPSSFPYSATIGLGTASAEQVLVTATGGGTSLTVTRNYNGQGAFSHPDADTFDHSAIAKDYQEANAHVNAASNVHGAVGAVVGTTDTQALSNKSITGDLPISGALTVTSVSTLNGGLVVNGGAEVDSGNFLVNGVGANITANHDVVAGHSVLAPGTRVQARYANGQSCPSGTTVLGSVSAPAISEFDTLGFVTTTGVATTPATGTYEISAQVMLSNSTGWTSAGIYKNGSLLTSMPVFANPVLAAAPSCEFSLTNGDTIDVRVVTTSTLTTVSSTTAKSYLRIKRIS